MNLIFGDITEKKGKSAALGNHNIDKAKVLAPTDSSVFSPTNPGNFDSIRTVPVCQTPRYFTRDEATALGELAREKDSQAKATKRAYKHLRSLEDSDKTVHQSHYKYAKKVASNELGKLERTTSYARHLHRLRPGYARLGIGLTQAENKATDAIASIKSGLK